MSKQLAPERRFIKAGQLRAKDGDKPGIEGVGAVYNEQYDSGWMIETIKPGAFARALKEKQDVRCLFNHDPNNVLGRTKSGTLSLSDSKDGLKFECDIDPVTRIGADVRGMIERGDVDGCSISFTVRSQIWREEKDDKGNYTFYREIEDVDLYDVGPVTFPAYEQTSVSARSLSDFIPAEIRSHIPALKPERADPATPAHRDADLDGVCDCKCEACKDERCEECGCDANCDAENCAAEDCRCGEGQRMRMRLRIAQAEL